MFSRGEKGGLWGRDSEDVGVFCSEDGCLRYWFAIEFNHDEVDDPEDWRDNVGGVPSDSMCTGEDTTDFFVGAFEALNTFTSCCRPLVPSSIDGTLILGTLDFERLIFPLAFVVAFAFVLGVCPSLDHFFEGFKLIVGGHVLTGTGTATTSPLRI